MWIHAQCKLHTVHWTMYIHIIERQLTESNENLNRPIHCTMNEKIEESVGVNFDHLILNDYPWAIQHFLQNFMFLFCSFGSLFNSPYFGRFDFFIQFSLYNIYGCLYVRFSFLFMYLLIRNPIDIMIFIFFYLPFVISKYHEQVWYRKYIKSHSGSFVSNNSFSVRSARWTSFNFLHMKTCRYHNTFLAPYVFIVYCVSTSNQRYIN